MGTFAEGTKETKIRAALQFIKNGDMKRLINESKKLEDRNYRSKITMHYE
jgi:carbamate kinase